VRATIREAAPDAEEFISYQMPTFNLRGKPLVYFGAFKNHFGLYPTPGSLEPFKDELTPYKNAKGSVRFSLTEPPPYDLISKIVTFRARETLAKAEGER